MLYPVRLSLSSPILAMMFSSKSTKRPLPDSTPALALAMIAWTAASTFSKIALTAGVAAAILASTAALILFKKSMMLSLTSPDSILALTWAKMSFKSWTASMISAKEMYSNGGDEVFNGMLKGRFEDIIEKVIKDVVSSK